MIARLYANENFPLPVVTALREFGHDVLTTRDAGKANEAIPDDEVLRFAVANGRALITHNRHDFIRLHSRFPDHEGIVACTENPDFTALAGKINSRPQSMETLRGQLVRINRGE